MKMGYVHRVVPGHHKAGYATLDLHLAYFSTGYLLSGTGESEAVEAKVCR